MHIHINMKLFFTLLLFVTGAVCRAADISFVVYQSKGMVTKTSSKLLLNKGDKLYLHEMLAIGEQSNVILICSNYKIIQITKKGNYAIRSLLSQCSKNASTYTSSYFKYVWAQLTHPHGSPDKSPEEYMQNVGAVSRGCNTVSTNIKLDTLNYLSGTLPIYWHSAYKNPECRIYDVPTDGGPLKKTSLIKEQPVLTAQVFKSLQPGEYYWQITEADGSSCERNYLKIWAAAEYKKEINRMLKMVPITSAAETAFIKGFVMEENHFMAEALIYYGQAAKANSKNSLYKKTLAKFYNTTF